MEIIPVMDLKGGLAVHAVRGERQLYQPVNSPLSRSGDPISLAAAFHDQFDFTKLYLADLDAIMGEGDNAGSIRELARHSGLQLMVDAGVSTREGASRILETGAGKVIIGSETLASWGAANEILGAFPAQELVFSLDMRAGRLLSAASPLAGASPLEALDLLAQAGWQEIILLDLARVGSAAGLDRDFLAGARQAHPELSLLVGGGVRDFNDLLELQSIGIQGVLVATILHQGSVTREQLGSLRPVSG